MPSRKCLWCGKDIPMHLCFCDDECKGKWMNDLSKEEEDAPKEVTENSLRLQEFYTFR